MFGRRKSRKQEEPLVPHGLIWQATDEPEEPSQPAEKPASSSEVIEMVLRRENPPDAAVPATTVPVAQSRDVAQLDASASRMGAISPPIPWPSPKTASVIRRAPPPTIPVITGSAIAASVNELEKRGLQVVAQAPAVPQAAVIEIQAAAAQVHKHSRRRENLAQIGRSLQQKVKDGYSGAARTFVLVRVKAQTTYSAINPRAKFTGALQLAQKKISVAISGCQAAGSRLRFGWATVSPRVARLITDGRRTASKAVRTSISRYGHLVQRAKSRRIRIRIETPVSTRAFVQRSMLAWAKGRESMRRESRLWTSVAMAALSALLAVGVISAVSRNAPPAHASNRSVANSKEGSSSAINPIIVVAPRAPSEDLAKAIPSASRRSSDSVEASSSEIQANSSRRETTRSAHHLTGDDYVAPNTYHYYGPNGKSKE